MVCFNSRPKASKRGFTRLDLLAVLAGLVLLAGLTVPGLATTRPRSERFVCLNNLRQVGLACQVWADAHGERNVWVAPASEGGTRGSSHALANHAWWQFAFMSNELATPKVLACPSDDSVRVATDFSSSPGGGLLSPAYRNNALSYFLGLHSEAQWPRSILAGDRNLTASALNQSCGYGGVTSTVRLEGGPGGAPAQWTNSLHGVTGNLLCNSGEVRETSTQDLQAALRVPDTDRGRTHILPVR